MEGGWNHRLACYRLLTVNLRIAPSRVQRDKRPQKASEDTALIAFNYLAPPGRRESVCELQRGEVGVATVLLSNNDSSSSVLFLPSLFVHAEHQEPHNQRNCHNQAKGCEV